MLDGVAQTIFVKANYSMEVGPACADTEPAEAPAGFATLPPLWFLRLPAMHLMLQHGQQTHAPDTLFKQ